MWEHSKGKFDSLAILRAEGWLLPVPTGLLPLLTVLPGLLSVPISEGLA